MKVARLLSESFRESDVIARMGGDEFCVLLTGTAEKDTARPLENLSDRIAARNVDPRHPYALAYSVGVVGYEPARHATVEISWARPID